MPRSRRPFGRSSSVGALPRPGRAEAMADIIATGVLDFRRQLLGRRPTTSTTRRRSTRRTRTSRR
eukprot:3559374-Alexandrium_andersonii.AAC.1